MPQIDIRIQGRPYSVECKEGDERRAHFLLAHINRHAVRLVAQLGNMPDAQLLLMTGMIVADELLEAQEKLQRLNGKKQSNGADDPDQMRLDGNGDDGSESEIAERIRATSQRLETLSNLLEQEEARDDERAD
ncbi:MAG: cell division protein ZapA [Hyphomicrobiales bacterium]|nr:cell division protein ZapA [Hyphomicrobiales bacterium]MCY4048777.1 cell division protein ZapA [Hyphomicrobiales bacterium]MCY4052335.1 cell division protein ZapA [Hyphomicrobiales bacterium]